MVDSRLVNDPSASDRATTASSRATAEDLAAMTDAQLQGEAALSLKKARTKLAIVMEAAKGAEAAMAIVKQAEETAVAARADFDVEASSVDVALDVLVVGMATL